MRDVKGVGVKSLHKLAEESSYVIEAQQAFALDFTGRSGYLDKGLDLLSVNNEVVPLGHDNFDLPFRRDGVRRCEVDFHCGEGGNWGPSVAQRE